MKAYILNLILLFLLIGLNQVIGQDTIEFTITITNPDLITKADNNNGAYTIEFANDDITANFAKYTITKFEQTYPNSRFEDLRNIWTIQTNHEGLIYTLESTFDWLFKQASIVPKPVYTYTPNDYIGVYPNRNDLDLINIRGAWDYSQGDTNTIIGVSDGGFDLNGIDIANQIHRVWSNNNWNQGHGTPVASVVGSQVDNNYGLTGVGFNCKLDFVLDGHNGILNMSLDGVKSVNASWYHNCARNTNVEMLYNEVYENGTVACFGAGNGLHLDTAGAVYRDDCGWGATYPPAYPHNISTTSVGCEHPRGTWNIHWLFGNTRWGWKDVHWHIYGEQDTIKKFHPGYPQFPVGYTFPREIHNHHETVDIAAPGYTVRVITPGNNYYGAAKGTSFASPMTAGVAGLMFSVNPCLTPYQVQYGIKTTAVNIDTIPENVPYAGKLGAGRLDAEAAVAWASTFNCNSGVATTMHIKGVEINTICQPGQSSNGVLPQLTPIIENGTPPYTVLWRPMALNQTSLDSDTILNPQITSSFGNHIVHYYLLVEDNSPVKKAAGRIVKIQLTNAQTYDLAMRDSYMDMFGEPNQQISVDPRDWSVWMSPDVWNRKSQDGILEHEHPEYFTTNPNYVYARVRNVGCTANPLGKDLRLYWSKASTGEDWDADWTTTNVIGTGGASVAGGREITTTPISIPILQPGDEFVTNHAWNPVKPADYAANINSVDVCFLARIEEDVNPPYGMTFLEDSIVKNNVFNNNNIVTRNFVVTDYKTGNNRNRHQILVGNAGEEIAAFDLEFINDRVINRQFSGDLASLGTVNVYLGDLYGNWTNIVSDKKSYMLSDTEKSISFDMGTAIRIEGLYFGAKERKPIVVELNGKNRSQIGHKFHLRQLEHDTKTSKDVVYGAIEFEIEASKNGPKKPKKPKKLKFNGNGPKKYILYPNPTQNDVFVKYTGNDPNNTVDLELIATNGSTLSQFLGVSMAPQQAKCLHIGHLPSGNYVIHAISSNGQAEAIQFIKQ